MLGVRCWRVDVSFPAEEEHRTSNTEHPTSKGEAPHPDPLPGVPGRGTRGTERFRLDAAVGAAGTTPRDVQSATSVVAQLKCHVFDPIEVSRQAGLLKEAPIDGDAADESQGTDAAGGFRAGEG